MSIFSNLIRKSQRALAGLFLQSPLSIRLPHPIVSFSFDDVHPTALTTGKQLLEKYGFHGTFYVSFGIKNEDGSPYFDRAALPGLIHDGHELGCHTFDHLHCATTPPEQLRKDLIHNNAQLSQIIPGAEFSNFSYPYGEHDIKAKNIIGSRFTSARGVNVGLNLGEIDLYNLKVIPIYSAESSNEIFDQIDEGIEKKAYMVFDTHDVQQNPSPWGTTPEYFESILKYCYDKGLRGYTIQRAVEILYLCNN